MLASASPRRRELLATLGVAFHVLPADIDETPPAGIIDPADIVRQLALAKAQAVAAGHPAAVVLGADTVVALDGWLLGKPADADEARAMLAALRGRQHRVATGVAVLARGAAWAAVAEARVWMRDYADREIAASIASGTPFDKAGGYAIQDPLLQPVARVDGCWCAVVGLPLAETSRLLASAGMTLAPSRDVLPARCRTCPRFPWSMERGESASGPAPSAG